MPSKPLTNVCWHSHRFWLFIVMLAFLIGDFIMELWACLSAWQASREHTLLELQFQTKKFHLGLAVDACNISFYLSGSVLWWQHVHAMENWNLKAYRVDFSDPKEYDWLNGNLNVLIKALNDQVWTHTCMRQKK